MKIGSRIGSSVGSRLEAADGPWRPGGNCPDRVTTLAENTRPISIDPLSPMNSRAGWKLWTRKPTQAPASAALSSAAVVARGRSLIRVSW